MKSIQIDDEINQRLREINIVSFSGGKDSSVVLQSVLNSIKETKKELHIITADTLMEIPYFKAYLDRTRTRIQAYIDSNGINAKIHTVYPEIQNSFWVSVIGMGYPAAHMGFRWCTGKLKIEPISQLIKKLTINKNFMVFVGVRSAESALRAKIYKQKDYKPNHYAPILDWSAHDVWECLMTELCPWGDHAELIQVYKYSSDECVYGEKQGVCVGNARYGCWPCPLQKVSQLELIGVNTNDLERYRALKAYKNALVSAANNRGYRSRIRRNFTEGCGPFLISARKKLYYLLKETEAVTGWKLITQEEEKLIYQHWEIDAAIHTKSIQPALW